MKNLTIAVCALLGIALFKLPYGYYTFLRIAVCAYCVYSLISLINKTKVATLSVILLAALAILYNPIIRVYANRDFWTVANIATIVVLVIIYFRGGKR